MTRETKIGLLVGLAFIIVIGILLSDHLTSSTEPPPAQLTQAGNSVRGGTQIPNAQNVALTPPVAPGPITPQAPVPTSYDLTPRPVGPVVQQIAIGGPAQGQGPSALMQRQPQPGTMTQEPVAMAQEPTAMGSNNVPPSYAPPVAIGPVSSEPLNHVVAVAHNAGEDLVPARGSVAGSAAPATGREYRAAAGDNLSKLAAKLPGGNTKANRDAIVAANPSLKANRDLVIAGRTYVLPAVAGGATAAAAPAVHEHATAVPAAARQERWYTVKQGDTLWGIASDGLGSASAVKQIKDLNKETLKGSDLVRAGMKLRLPAKAVATAAD